MLGQKLAQILRAAVGTALYWGHYAAWLVIIAGGLVYVLRYIAVAVGPTSHQTASHVCAYGLLAVAALTWVVYWYGHCATWSRGMREITSEHDPEIYTIASEQAQLAGVPLPRIYEIKSGSPNARAIGRSSRHAILVVASELRCILNRRELRALLAHEMAHVRNGDTLIMTAVVTSVGFALGASMLIGPYGWMGAIVLLMTGVSWWREWHADTTAANLCGEPKALASALSKLRGSGSRSLLRNLPSPIHTHPPMPCRIRKLTRCQA